MSGVSSRNRGYADLPLASVKQPTPPGKVRLRTRGSRNPQPLELRFRALLTEEHAEVLFHREASDRTSEVSA